MVNPYFRAKPRPLIVAANPLRNFKIRPLSQPIIGFDDTQIILFGTVINTAILMGVFYPNMFFTGPYDRYIALWVGIIVFMFIHWYGMRYLYLELVRRYPGFDNRRHRIARLPLVVLAYFVITLVLDLVTDPFLIIDDPLHEKPPLTRELITGLVIATVDIAMYEFLHYIIDLKNRRIKEEELKKEALNSELVGLRNQLSPHFLFNNLSALLYLIENNKERSIDFVHKLSSVYSYIIRHSEHALVSLSEELEFVKAYSFLLEERYGDNLDIQFSIDPIYLNHQLVPLAIQSAVENAIKHNSITQASPLHIEIKTEEDYLSIRNNLQPKRNPHERNGTGLKNINSRFKLVTDKTIEIQWSDNSFLLKLPLQRSA